MYIKLPGWAFDSSESFAWASNVPSVSRFYPAYTYGGSANGYISRANNPAFVSAGNTGGWMQGGYLYGDINSSIVDDYNTHKEFTQVWSQAIPKASTETAAICTVFANVYMLTQGLTPGPSYAGPFIWYIDKDHILKVGAQAKGNNNPPYLLLNTNIDMTPYMYPSTTVNTDNYCGHRYALTYNSDTVAFDLYVDNTSNILYSTNIQQLAYNILSFQWPTYIGWFNSYGWAFLNVNNIGAGAYMSNSVNQNVYAMNNIFIDSWTAWESSLPVNQINNIMLFNAEYVYVPTNSSLPAFEYCSRLEDLTVPGNFENIPQYFAYGCYNLKSITFLNGIKQISRYAVQSSNNLNVSIPRSVNNISSQAFIAPVISKQTLSWKVPMRYNMFNISRFKDIAHYEYPSELYYNLSLKQIKPVDLNMGITSLRVSGIADINIEQNPIVINKEAKEDARVLFNANDWDIFPSLSNAVIHQVSNIDNNGFYLTARSIQFPALSNSVYCQFLNTEGFEYTAVNNYAVNIVNHSSGIYATVPSTIDRQFLISTIKLNANLPIQDINIYGINKLYENGIINTKQIIGTPYIFNSYNNMPFNVNIINSYFINCSSSFKNTSGSIVFINCEHVVVDNTTDNFEFNNCNKLYITNATANIFVNYINNLYALPYISDSSNLEASLPTDLFIPCLRGMPSSGYLYYEAENISIQPVSMSSFSMNNATLNSLVIDNYFGCSKSMFTNTHGNFSVDILNAYCSNITGNNFIISNAIDNITTYNISANTLHTYNYSSNGYIKNYSYLHIGAATNCSIDNVHLNLNTANALDEVEEITFANCVINNAIVNSNNIPSLFLRNSAVNNLIVQSAIKEIGPSAFSSSDCKNAVINSNIQPILDNAPILHNTSLYQIATLDTDLNISLHGTQSMYSVISSKRYSENSTVKREGFNSISFACLDNYYSNKYGLTELLISNYLYYNGGVIAANSFTNMNCQQIIIDNNCTRILTNAFYNSTGFSSINIPSDCLSIGSNAFYNCSMLTDIYMSSNTELGYNAIPSSATIHYYTDTPNNLVASNSLLTTYGAAFTNVKASYSAKAQYGNTLSVVPFDVYPPYRCPVASSTRGVDKSIIIAKGFRRVVNTSHNTCGTVTTGTVMRSGTSIYYTHTSNNSYAYITNGASGSVLYDISSNIPITDLIVAGTINHIWKDCKGLDSVVNLIFANTGAYSGSTAKDVQIANKSSIQYIRYMGGVTSSVNMPIVSNCRSLTIMQFTAQYGAGIIPSQAISGCNSLQEIYLHTGTSSRFIFQNAVVNCNSLTYIDFSMLKNTNIVIYNNAFVNCYGLTKIDLPSGVKNICSGAFNRTSIKAVNIPTGCVVGANAFPSDCTITYI